jgi:hypothetical protein
MDLTSFFEDEPAIEKYMRENIEASPNMMVPYYLMASYAYYEQDDPIVSDSFFDRLAKDLLKEYDRISHRHKSLLTRDMLRAGTYIGEYPSIVEGAVESLRSKFGDEK